MNKIDKPYVYKVIEKDTGRFYIGKKVAKNKEGYYPMIGEEYFTSSTNKEFKNKFQKHPEKFICEILKYGTDIKDTSIFESEEIIKEKDNPLILNRAIPGEANGGSLQFVYDDKWLEAITKGHRKAYADKNSKQYKDMIARNKLIGERAKKKYASMTPEERKEIFNHKQTEDTKKKISDASKKMWEKDPERNLMKQILNKRTKNGWHSNKGIVYPFKFLWINDGKRSIRIKEADEIPEGWKKGRLPFNTMWINNGEQNKLIPKNEQIPEGWKKGKLNKLRRK